MKVVRILARSLMYPLMLHPETPVRSLLLEDMSDQEGVGSASNPEATLTHPSARDPSATRGNLPPSLCSGYDSPPSLRYSHDSETTPPGLAPSELTSL